MMGIFDRKSSLRISQIQIQALEKQINKLQQEIQNLIIDDDILSVQTQAGNYKGNEYQSYAKAVASIDEKYRGIADWGGFIVGTIIDIRAAFIIGQGLRIIENAEGAEREKAFAEALLEENNLDHELAQEFAKEAEIEGKILLQLFEQDTGFDFFEGQTKGIAIRFIPWTAKKYSIITDPKDYLRYIKATWKEAEKEYSLEAPDFIYKKFGGRVDTPDEAAPKIMKCLTECDFLGKALRDWREINRIYAAPVPHFKVDTPQDVPKVQASIADKNFKIKKLFAHIGDFQFSTPDMQGATSIKEEITFLSKFISGATGIPVHFLGFPDLMSNRATADDLRELVNASTTKERAIWRGAYEETIRKAIEKFNRISGAEQKSTKLDPSKISIDIPFISQDQWLHLQNVYLPAAIAGMISKDAFQEQIPGFDLEAEKEREAQEEEKKSEEEEKQLIEDAKKLQQALEGEQENALSERTQLPPQRPV